MAGWRGRQPSLDATRSIAVLLSSSRAGTDGPAIPRKNTGDLSAAERFLGPRGAPESLAASSSGCPHRPRQRGIRRETVPLAVALCKGLWAPLIAVGFRLPLDQRMPARPIVSQPTLQATTVAGVRPDDLVNQLGGPELAEGNPPRLVGSFPSRGGSCGAAAPEC